MDILLLPIYNIVMEKFLQFLKLAAGWNPPGRRAKPRRIAVYPARSYLATTKGSITAGVVFIAVSLISITPTVWELTAGNVIANANQKNLDFGDNVLGDNSILEEDSDGNTIVVDEKATLPSIGDGVQLGQIFARLYVPTFGDDYEYIIAHGTYGNVLKQAIGHYVSSVLPGERGNFAIAGHRTAHGAPLLNTDKLKKGDRLVIEVADAYYLYEHNNTVIVSPQEVGVIGNEPDAFLGDASGKTILTLTTCHPKYSDAQRLVAFNVLVGVYSKETHTLEQVLAAPKTFTHYVFSE
jgi:sortase A